LLDASGFCRIADFGFAKELTASNAFRTLTLCGTPDYLAPEVILGTGHSFGFDWWCVGIFIYELLCGWPPFCDPEGDIMKVPFCLFRVTPTLLRSMIIRQTYEKILAGNMSFPDHLTQSAKDIITELLQYNPADRLGVRGGTSATLHPWFKGFDMDALLNKTMNPPVVPNVKNSEDLRNFDAPEDGNVDRDFVDPFTETQEDYDWLKEF